MRLNLRLHGRTASGEECQADVSIYPTGPNDLQKKADEAATTAAWMFNKPPFDPVPEGSHITVENVEAI